MSVGWDALLYNLITTGGDMVPILIWRISPPGAAHMRDPAGEQGGPKVRVTKLHVKLSI
jgi:hypothetical protein